MFEGSMLKTFLESIESLKNIVVSQPLRTRVTLFAAKGKRILNFSSCCLEITKILFEFFAAFSAD